MKRSFILKKENVNRFCNKKMQMKKKEEGRAGGAGGAGGRRHTNGWMGRGGGGMDCATKLVRIQIDL
jgi:hypothetical protein